MKCPRCQNEFSLESGFCDQCAYELPVEEREQETYEGPLTIATTLTSLVEAELLAGSLRSEGIPAFCDKRAGHGLPHTMGGTIAVAIYVPEEALEQARQKIAEWKEN